MVYRRPREGRTWIGRWDEHREDQNMRKSWAFLSSNPLITLSSVVALRIPSKGRLDFVIISFPLKHPSLDQPGWLIFCTRRNILNFVDCEIKPVTCEMRISFLIIRRVVISKQEASKWFWIWIALVAPCRLRRLLLLTHTHYSRCPLLIDQPITFSDLIFLFHSPFTHILPVLYGK